MSSSRLPICFGVLLCGLFLLTAAAGLCAEPLRDPTRPPRVLAAPAPAERTTGWQVSSILISPGRRVATVNGQAVQVGDRIAGARVTAIAADSVRLRKENKEFTVRLQTQRIKKPVQKAGANDEGK
ncbi:MAG: hypothetical protein AB7F21_02640 [Desulfuromonadales bacterium]|uniref:hypothetical protein n=1 Tax=Desulfuromonas sp. KJ2020 TaxID=2919173 RepID=UPI0020A75BDF|nr:hypothetical protein [Desulfuromonas sp. KJ2020]MCP3176604.1 hypothetical protein [Desulfuromonas sp. KJ2020]